MTTVAIGSFAAGRAVDQSLVCVKIEGESCFALATRKTMWENKEVMRESRISRMGYTTCSVKVVSVDKPCQNRYFLNLACNSRAPQQENEEEIAQRIL